MQVQREQWPKWADPKVKLLKLKVAKVKSGSDINVSEHTMHLEPHSRASQVAQADLCSLPKAATTGLWASELDHRAVDDGLVWWVMFSVPSHGCLTRLGNLDALWEEGSQQRLYGALHMMSCQFCNSSQLIFSMEAENDYVINFNHKSLSLKLTLTIVHT